jgi:hypothetical protein
MEYKINAQQAAQIAEQWLKDTRGVDLRADGPGILKLGDPDNPFNKTDSWVVFFEFDEPGLRHTSLDHMILKVDAQTGEVRQTHPYIDIDPGDEDDDRE